MKRINSINQETAMNEKMDHELEMKRQIAIEKFQRINEIVELISNDQISFKEKNDILIEIISASALLNTRSSKKYIDFFENISKRCLDRVKLLRQVSSNRSLKLNESRKIHEWQNRNFDSKLF